ncbi:MAG: hypothetical protein Q7U51_03845 [Methanoregula sp.]|nr:hypothetical protein [Methanoregula sp.]
MEKGKGKFTAIALDPFSQDIKRSPSIDFRCKPLDDAVLCTVAMHLLEFRPFTGLCCVDKINNISGEQAEGSIVFIEYTFVEFSRRIIPIVLCGFINGDFKVWIRILSARKERLLDDVFEFFFRNVDHAPPITVLYK